MKTSCAMALACGVVAAALSLPVGARGGAGGGGGGGFSHGSPTGPAGNSAASANSNGRFASDRDKGRERAEDRMSAQGLQHQKATSATRGESPPKPLVKPVAPRR